MDEVVDDPVGRSRIVVVTWSTVSTCRRESRPNTTTAHRTRITAATAANVLGVGRRREGRPRPMRSWMSAQASSSTLSTVARAARAVEPAAQLDFVGGGTSSVGHGSSTSLRSFSARCSIDFTVPVLHPSTWAISARGRSA